MPSIRKNSTQLPSIIVHIEIVTSSRRNKENTNAFYT